MKPFRILLTIGAIALLALLPQVIHNEYYIHQVVLIAIYAVLLFGSRS